MLSFLIHVICTLTVQILKSMCRYVPPFSTILDYDNFTIGLTPESDIVGPIRKTSLDIVQQHLRKVAAAKYAQAKDRLSCASRWLNLHCKDRRGNDILCYGETECITQDMLPITCSPHSGALHLLLR